MLQYGDKVQLALGLELHFHLSLLRETLCNWISFEQARSLQPTDELFLFLNLALGSKQHDLADRHDVHQSTVSQIITTWSNFVYTVLDAIRIWIPAKKLNKYMLAEFKPEYADSTVILDCTGLPVPNISFPPEWSIFCLQLKTKTIVFTIFICQINKIILLWLLQYFSVFVTNI